MKEYSYSLTEHCTNGLRPHARVPREQKYCEDLYGLVPARVGQGLEAPNALVYPVTGVSKHYSMEFLDGATGRFLISMESGVEKIYSLSSAYAASVLKDFSGGLASVETDTGSTVPVEAGVWHSASIGDLLVLTNGSYWISNCSLYTSWAIGTSSTPLMQTCCAWNDRLVVGGLNPADGYFAGATWTEIWSTFRQYSKIDPGPSLTAAHVFLGLPRGGDIVKPGVLEHTMLTGYDYAANKAVLLEQIREGRIQVLRIPSSLSTLRVLPLGQDLMVYGLFGVYKAGPGGDVSWVADATPYDRNCISGNERVHYFTDKEQDLWQTDGQTATWHGYKEFLGAIPYQTLTLDGKFSELYITGGTSNFRNSTGTGIKSYLWRGGKLSESRYRPTSLFSDGSTFGAITEDGGATFRILSTPFNFDRQGYAKVVNLILQYDGLSSPIGDLRYRYFEEATFRTETERLVGGVAFLNLSGVEFKAGVTGTVASGAYVGQLKARYNITDHRFVRGLTTNEQRPTNGDVGT